MCKKIDIYSKNYQPEETPKYIVKLFNEIGANDDVRVLQILRRGIYSELSTFGLIINNYESTFGMNINNYDMVIDNKDFDEDCYEKYKLDCSEYFYLTNLFNTVTDKIYYLTHREGI